MVVYQMDWNGYIYLNGIGIEEWFYDCEFLVIYDQQKGIVVEKSLYIVGLYFMLYVLCIEGFCFFMKYVINFLSIVLLDIVFVGIFLIFWDCYVLMIFNCFF